MDDASPDQTVMAHFYRASVMHADVWRQRLDATTNWAIVTNAAMLSFTLSQPDTPHFIVLLLIGVNFLLLIMESRRYQLYDLWRRRIRCLDRYFIAAQLAPGHGPSPEHARRELKSLADDLGHSYPQLSLIDALGYRLRRNYGYIQLIALGTWCLKLFIHPTPVSSATYFVRRAHIGYITGPMTMTMVISLTLIVVFVALRAPSEQMVAWQQLPSPIERLFRLPIFHRRMALDEEENFHRHDPKH